MEFTDHGLLNAGGKKMVLKDEKKKKKFKHEIIHEITGN